MPKSKKLQKVTDFEKLKTEEQVRAFLENNPENYDELLESLQNRLNDSYKKKLGQEHTIVILIIECHKFNKSKTGEEWVRNVTYEINHSMIASNIHNYVLENRTFPTIHHIAEETGLSRTTIYRHLKNGLKTEYNSVITGKMEYMATHALEKLYLIGIQDNNATALKNYIELSGAINKQPTTNVNNYIQINNLKISKDEFDQLPNDTIIQIEKLISDNLTKSNLGFQTN